jgi:hypothetical protein
LWWCAEEAFSTRISLHAFAGGAVLMREYLVPMAARVYGEHAPTARDRNAAPLPRWILSSHAREVHARHVQREVRLSGLETAGESNKQPRRLFALAGCSHQFPRRVLDRDLGMLTKSIRCSNPALPKRREDHHCRGGAVHRCVPSCRYSSGGLLTLMGSAKSPPRQSKPSCSPERPRRLGLAATGEARSPSDRHWSPRRQQIPSMAILHHGQSAASRDFINP